MTSLLTKLKHKRNRAASIVDEEEDFLFLFVLDSLLLILQYLFSSLCVSLTCVLWVCVWVAVDVMMDDVVLMAVVEFGWE